MITLETMAILARKGSLDPGCKELSKQFRHIIGLDSWLRSVFVYRDENAEVLRDVPFMMHDLETKGHMEGDCDDMCIMCCAILKCMNIPARMTAIQSTSPLEFDHVFSEARIGLLWMPIDPTVQLGTPYYQYGYMSEVV
jgi:hypothetical protein